MQCRVKSRFVRGRLIYLYCLEIQPMKTFNVSDNLTGMDRQLLSAIRARFPEWLTRRKIARSIGRIVTTHIIHKIESLVKLRLIESRQSKNKKGTMLWEYRAKDEG